MRVELAALLPLHLIAAGARLPVSSLARKSDGPLVVAASLAIDGRRLLLRGRLGQDARGHLAVAAPHARVVQVPRAAVDAARLLPAVDAAAPIALCRAADAGQERLRARFVHAADDASGAPSHEVATREVVSETPVETAGDYLTLVLQRRKETGSQSLTASASALPIFVQDSLCQEEKISFLSSFCLSVEKRWHPPPRTAVL